MRKSSVLAVGLAVAFMFASGARVLAHSGSGEAGIQVEPDAVTAGGTAVLAGTGLEPTSDRVLTLVGTDLSVQLGKVTTSADGTFSDKLTIPPYLPSGTYTLEAIGDETLTASLAVTALAGGNEEVSPQNGPSEMVTPRDRSPLELGLIVVVVVILVAIGALLVLRAERFRGLTAA